MFYIYYIKCVYISHIILVYYIYYILYICIYNKDVSIYVSRGMEAIKIVSYRNKSKDLFRYKVMIQMISLLFI